MMLDGSSLQKSHSEGTVSLTSTSGSRFAGGLIGVAETKGGTGTIGSPLVIQQVYSHSNVYGDSANAGNTGDVGGLLGIINSGAELHDSYSLGKVNGPTSSTSTNRGVGGLIGRALNMATQVYNVYSAGRVSGSASANQIGGLIGSSEITADSSFWNVDSSGQSSSAGGATGLTDAQMKTQSTFISAGWDFNDVWEIVGENYPRLKENLDTSLPVELTSFTATVSGALITLEWKTASEVNCYGFEIERRPIVVSNLPVTDTSWQKIGFVEGAGSSSTSRDYSFTDSKLPVGRYEYRLKQIDLDGSSEYSHSVAIEIGVPKEFALYQNYPNPLNPMTVIGYQLPFISKVSLKIYDILGREVETLVNGLQEAGSYEVQFDARLLANGIYFYQLNAGDFSVVKKLVIVK